MDNFRLGKENFKQELREKNEIIREKNEIIKLREERLEYNRKDFESEIKEFKYDKKDLENEIQELKIVRAKCQQEIDVFKEQINMLEKDKTQSDMHIKDLKCEIEYERENFYSEKKELEYNIQDLETKNDKLNKIIDEQNKEKVELQLKIENLTKKLEEMKKESCNNSERLEFAKIFVDEEKKSLQAKHDEDLLKIGKLEAEKVVLENNFNEILKEKSAFEEKIALIEEEIAELKDENLKLDSDNKILYSTKANLERDLYDKNAIINRIEKDNNNLRDKLTDYKIIIHDLESKVRNL